MRLSVTILSIFALCLWAGVSLIWFFNYENSFIRSFSNGLFDTTAGQMGAPVNLNPDNLSKKIQQKITDSFDKHGYNSYASDLIGFRRSLPDPRPSFCNKIEENLPKTSVIITFCDEPYSLLIRTINSLLNNTSQELLKEIILVDDASTDIQLEKKLADYWLNEQKIKIIRSKERKGLSSSRMIGLKYASAKVVTFADSNCEFPVGWLEPLLKEIKTNQNVVVSPVLDIIDPYTFEYKITKHVFVGGFNWNLKFKWLAIPPRQDKTEAVATPILPGAIFSVSTSFLLKIGGFDEDLSYTGGEIFDISFRGWMCGGIMKIVPCSHVGYLFPMKIPQKQLPEKEYLLKNLVRIAVAWMDDYAGFFYQRSGIRYMKPPDVSKQFQVRRQVNCNSFEWYLKNVYRDLHVPKDIVFGGRLRNWDFGVCLGSQINPYNVFNSVNLDVDCERSEENFWLFTNDSKIRQDDFCLERNDDGVHLKLCSDNKFQLWTYDGKSREIRPQDDEKEMCFGVFLNTETNDRNIGIQKCKSKYFGKEWTFEVF